MSVARSRSDSAWACLEAMLAAVIGPPDGRCLAVGWATAGAGCRGGGRRGGALSGPGFSLAVPGVLPLAGFARADPLGGCSWP